jgi:hypothetical protein
VRRALWIALAVVIAAGVVGATYYLLVLAPRPSSPPAEFFPTVWSVHLPGSLYTQASDASAFYALSVIGYNTSSIGGQSAQNYTAQLSAYRLADGTRLWSTPSMQILGLGGYPGPLALLLNAGTVFLAGFAGEVQAAGWPNDTLAGTAVYLLGLNTTTGNLVRFEKQLAPGYATGAATQNSQFQFENGTLYTAYETGAPNAITTVVRAQALVPPGVPSSAPYWTRSIPCPGRCASPGGDFGFYPGSPRDVLSFFRGNGTSILRNSNGSTTWQGVLPGAAPGMSAFVEGGNLVYVSAANGTAELREMNLVSLTASGPLALPSVATGFASVQPLGSNWLVSSNALPGYALLAPNGAILWTHRFALPPTVPGAPNLIESPIALAPARLFLASVTGSSGNLPPGAYAESFAVVAADSGGVSWNRTNAFTVTSGESLLPLSERPPVYLPLAASGSCLFYLELPARVGCASF